MQELARKKEDIFATMGEAVEAGERLYPSTAPEGREIVREQLAALKHEWSGLFDEVLNAQRELEVNVVQWTSFEDSVDQVERWLRKLESALTGDVPLRNTLDEKKGQLLNYKV